MPKIVLNSYPTHGSGGLYSVFLAFTPPHAGRPYGRGIRLSLGGYGWKRAPFRPHWVRYCGTATHFGIGPVCLSLCFPTMIPGRFGWWLWERFGIA